MRPEALELPVSSGQKHVNRTPERCMRIISEGDFSREKCRGEGRVEVLVLVFFFSHLSTNRSSTPIRVHARRNIHAHQLLEEQLRRIRDMDLRDLGLGLAILA
jgi:hypothetical protein